jgi:hypothetical protein
MVVTVVAVRMMEAAVHEIIDMITMRHGFVAAIRPVPVRCLVSGRVMRRLAAGRVAIAHRDNMMLGTATLGMLKATVIEVVDVVFVSHAEMTATWAMNVQRSLVGCHGESCVAHPQLSARIIPKLATSEKWTSARPHYPDT